jgi:hypothetical protein
MHIPAGARLVWSCQPTNPNINPDTYGFFSATLYGSDGRIVDGAGGAYGYGRGAYTFRHEGDYYLSVDAVEESWSMTLQVLR